jgi:hypothetical protein
MLHEIMNSEKRAGTDKEMKAFATEFEAKYPKAWKPCRKDIHRRALASAARLR